MTIKALFAGLLAFSISLLFISSTHAGVYKWVDENGQVHYGERPLDSSAQKMTIRQNETTSPRQIKQADDAGKANNAETQDTASPDADTNTENKDKKPEKPEKPKISKKEKRRLCDEAKSDIASINSRGRMREISKKGEYVFLSEKQRQQRLSAAKKKQREYCR